MKRVLILLGPPGSGKGSQAFFLKEKYNLPHVSAGDLLRSEVDSKSHLGNKIKDVINSGKLLDDTLITEIIKIRLSKSDCNNGVLLDGYPRTLNQAKHLENILSEIKLVDNIFTLDFFVPDEVLLKRLLGRYTCTCCNAVYNKYYRPTKIENLCDHCGNHDFIFRNDDNEQAIKIRLQEYHKNIGPLLSYYEEKKLRFKIDASLSVKEVSEQILNIIR